MKKLGLALGGGGARGLAHIGVIKAPKGDVHTAIRDSIKLVEIGYEYTISEWQRFIGAADDCTVFL